MKHDLVESPYQCAVCFELGDKKSDLLSKPCSGISPVKPESKTVVERDTASPARTGDVSCSTAHREPYQVKMQKELVDEMDMLNKELQRLQLLKTLQDERERLSQLIAMKTNSSILLQKNITCDSFENRL